MKTFDYQKISAALIQGAGLSIDATETAAIFSKDLSLGQSVAALDELAKKHKLSPDLGDFLFDTLLASHLNQVSADDKEAYLETPEWQQYEEKYLNRGSELLNLFIYLSEAMDEGVEVSLDDFLEEFLLVSDELYQDEHELYEPLIKGREYINESVEDFLSMPQPAIEPELQDFYRPLMLFFHPEFQDGKAPTSFSANEKSILFALLECRRQMMS